jgi:hypothetical protein
VTLKGEAVFKNGLKSDTVYVNSGKAIIPIKSTQNIGMTNISASFTTLVSNEIQISSKKGTMQVRINPPLMSRASWMPKQVDVFVNFMTGKKWDKSATNKVTLNVYNKQHELLDTYAKNAKNGEVIFKDISYYKRPAQCFFELKCDGYETVVCKVFENTWDK